MAKAKKEMSQFIVIGLGAFGESLARKLSLDGAEVLAIDSCRENVNAIVDRCTQALCADASDEHTLKSLGVHNFDAVAVCVGDVEASIIITLLCKQMEAPYVIVKAQNALHKTVLEKIGADMVILPEEYMGQKIATMLTNRTVFDVAELTDNFRIVDIKTPVRWRNKSIIELDIRKKFGVQILLVKRGEQVIVPTGEQVLNPEDDIILCGETDNIDRITRKEATVMLDDIDELL